MKGGALFIAVFLACSVEAVEATTIVLAAGTAHKSWRSALLGVAAGLGVLAVVVAALGPAVTAVPLRGLRLAVGGLLLIFGLQWLRKAILRASGHKAPHDEAQIFLDQLASAEASAAQRRGGVPDWYAFTLSFKGVVLEGLEVAFITLTFGSNQHDIPLAAVAAVAAVMAVAAAGFAVRAPLSRVPENTMKFVVGVMLTSFGMFWGGEGAGARWPGSDASLPVIVAAVAVFAVFLTAALRRERRRARSPGRQTRPSGERPVMPRLRSFFAFWYDFVVGDDWRVAAAVVVALAATYGLSRISGSAWWLLPVAVTLFLPYSLWRTTRR